LFIANRRRYRANTGQIHVNTQQLRVNTVKVPANPRVLLAIVPISLENGAIFTENGPLPSRGAAPRKYNGLFSGYCGVFSRLWLLLQVRSGEFSRISTEYTRAIGQNHVAIRAITVTSHRRQHTTPRSRYAIFQFPYTRLHTHEQRAGFNMQRLIFIVFSPNYTI
jgi:hypothetical protein